MSKKNKKSNQSSAHSYNINDFSSFDYEKMAKAIIEAKTQKDLELEKKRKEDKEKEHKEYLHKIGIKEYPVKCGRIKRRIIDFRNDIVYLYRFVTFKKSDVDDGTFTFALVQLATSGILGMIRYALMFVVLLLFVLGFKLCTAGSYGYGFLSFVFLFSVAIIVRALKISQYEVDKNNDKNYLLTLLSTITCFIAMVLSIISIIISLK